jgi:hypothetical protein
MRVHFPTRAFDAVTFSDLADYWWQAHGSKTRSAPGRNEKVHPYRHSAQ